MVLHVPSVWSNSASSKVYHEGDFCICRYTLALFTVISNMKFHTYIFIAMVVAMNAVHDDESAGHFRRHCLYHKKNITRYKFSTLIFTVAVLITKSMK